jgi:periplasmic divalent cation tolerance protein
MNTGILNEKLLMKNCLLYLTCRDRKEAKEITKILLNKRLIVCAKSSPVRTSFLWKGKIDKANEVLVIMDSIEENFEKVRKEIVKVHSYKTFVLLSMPVSQTTKEVEKWVKQELIRK